MDTSSTAVSPSDGERDLVFVLEDLNEQLAVELRVLDDEEAPVAGAGLSDASTYGGRLVRSIASAGSCSVNVEPDAHTLLSTVTSPPSARASRREMASLPDRSRGGTDACSFESA